jgi:hypothetical protein
MKLEEVAVASGNPLRLSSLQGFRPHHNITVEIPVGHSFGRTGAKYSREHKNERNFSAGNRSQTTCTPARIPGAKSYSL